MSGGTLTAGRLKASDVIGGSDATRAGPKPGWELAHIERARSDPAAFAPLYEAYADLVRR